MSISAVEKLSLAAKTFIALAFIFVFSLAINLAQSQDAHANYSMPPISSDLVLEQSGSISVGTGGVGPLPGSGGGGDDSAKLVIQVPNACVASMNRIALGKNTSGWLNANHSCYPLWKVRSHFHPASLAPQSVAAQCPVRQVNGFKVEAKGMISTHLDRFRLGITDSKKLLYRYVMTSTKITCVYPKTETTSKVARCLIKGSATFSRTSNSYAGAKKWPTTTKNFGTVAQIINDHHCVTSGTISSSVKIPVSNEDNWGNYNHDGNITVATCRIGRSTFNGATRVVYKNCNTSTDTANKKLAFWCNGGTMTGHRFDKSWTIQDCAGSNWTCTVPKATFDGKTGTVQTIRDGSGRVLDWGNYKTSGISSTHSHQYLTQVVKNSSPWNSKVSATSNQQLFWTNQTVGSWKGMSGINGARKTNVGFYEASNPGGGFTMTREQRLKGSVSVSVSQIHGFDAKTMKPVMSTSKRTMPSREWLECNSQTSPKMQPVRAIGTSF